MNLIKSGDLVESIKTGRRFKVNYIHYERDKKEQWASLLPVPTVSSSEVWYMPVKLLRRVKK